MINDDHKICILVPELSMPISSIKNDKISIILHIYFVSLPSCVL